MWENNDWKNVIVKMTTNDASKLHTSLKFHAVNTGSK